MNKRIKLLSEQAEKYADDNFRGEPTWSEAFESKFAELIIAECVQICEQGTATQTTSSGAASMIKQHFGVE